MSALCRRFAFIGPQQVMLADLPLQVIYLESAGGLISGTISADDSMRSPSRCAAESVGFAFQSEHLIPESDVKMTVFDTDEFQKASWLRQAPTMSGLSPSSGKDLTLHVDSLVCERKNEISIDEIRMLTFWSTRDGATSGFVSKEFDFTTAGESQDPNLSIELSNFASDQILFVFLYEEDQPPIDPNDSIGLVAIFPDLSINAFAGDLSKPSEPESPRFLTPKPLTVSLDARLSGQYSIVLRVDS